MSGVHGLMMCMSPLYRRFCSQNTWDPLHNSCSAPEQTAAEPAPAPVATPGYPYKSTMQATGRGRKIQKHPDMYTGGSSSGAVFGAAGMPSAGQLTGATPGAKWVQCDHHKCLKWRVVPPHIDIKSLPPKWCVPIPVLLRTTLGTGDA